MSERRRVRMHHMNLWDDGPRHGLGVPSLIAFAEAQPDIAAAFDLGQVVWNAGGPRGERPSRPDPDAIAERALGDDPWMVTFTLTPWSEKVFLAALDRIKARRPEVLVAVGGPMATDSGAELLRGHLADYLVRGYGERVFVELLRGNDAPGLYVRRGDRFVGSAPDPAAAGAIAELPSPFRMNLVELGASRRLHVEWSRGCPFGCSYCSWGLGNRKLVLAPRERMIDDIRFARERGMAEVVLNCSAINFSTDKLASYVDAMKAGDPGGELAFTAFILYETLTEEQLELLGKVRFSSLCMGLQTDEAVGRDVVGRPRFDRERFEWAVREVGRFTRPGVSIITAIPGDTLDKFRTRLDYLLDDLDADITVFPLEVAPGTAMWQRREELGIEPDASRQYWVYETPTLSASDHLACIEHANGRLGGHADRKSHGVSASEDFFAGLARRLRGGRRLVSLNDTIVHDGGTKVGLGVPFLISHARRRPKITDAYELRHASWRVGSAQTDTRELVDDVVRATLDDPPDVLGMSLQAWNYAAFIEAIRRIKRQRPDVITLVGGPMASDLGAELLESVPELDFVLRGFAERSFSDFLEALGAERAFERIGGLCYRNDAGEVKDNPLSTRAAEVLDDCGAPLQDGLVPVLGEQTLLNVEWTRGCPYSCAFCSWSMGERKLRRFSEEYIARDIACVLEAGFRELLICDPAINFSTPALESLVRAIERADPERQIGYHAFLQYPCVDVEQALLLERVRWNRLMLGLQTDDAEGLRALNRPAFRREAFEHAFRLAARAATPTVDLMTAVPGDTPEKILGRVRYILDLGGIVAIFPLLALPGSELWRRRQEYALDVDASRFHVVRSLPTMSEAEYRDVVVELQRMADAGAKLEVAGYAVLFGSGESSRRQVPPPRPAGRTRPPPGFRIDKGENVFIHQAFNCCPYAGLITAKIHDFVETNGYRVVDDPGEAAAVVINTCGYNDTRSQLAYDAIRTVRSANPTSPLVVAGCLTKIEPNQVKAALTGVAERAILGPADLGELDLIFDSSASRFEDTPTAFQKDRYTSADPRLGLYQITVGTGCQGRCRFCAIRRAQGRPLSLPLERILERVRRGIAEGHRDFFLAGSDISSWGSDLGLSIVDLLGALCRIEADVLFSAEAFEPTHLFTHLDALLPLFETGKFSWLVIPVQSGSQRILELMRRTYRIDAVMEGLRRLKQADPTLVTCTDVIYGYEDETWEEFQMSIAVGRQFDFAKYNNYEPRSGTPPLRLPPSEMVRRREAVMEELRRQGPELDVLTRKRIRKYTGSLGSGEERERSEMREFAKATAERFQRLVAKKSGIDLGGGWAIRKAMPDPDESGAALLEATNGQGRTMTLALAHPRHPGPFLASSERFRLFLRGQGDVVDPAQRRALDRFVTSMGLVPGDGAASAESPAPKATQPLALHASARDKWSSGSAEDASVAEAQRKLGNWHEAGEALERALASEPDSLAAWLNLALLEAERGRRGRMKSAAERVQSLAPELVERALAKTGRSLLDPSSPSSVAIVLGQALELFAARAQR